MQTILCETVICAEYTAHLPLQTMKNGRCKHESKHFVLVVWKETKPSAKFHNQWETKINGSKEFSLDEIILDGKTSVLSLSYAHG